MIKQGHITKWEGCYSEGWGPRLVPEAFSHPAKASYNLLLKIFSHAQEEGWIKKGSLILDPFGGIGTTGIVGAYQGMRVVCVELEPKFVDLGNQNFRRDATRNHQAKIQTRGTEIPPVNYPRCLREK